MRAFGRAIVSSCWARARLAFCAVRLRGCAARRVAIVGLENDRARLDVRKPIWL